MAQPLIPFVPWLRRYRVATLRLDFVAALTVAVVAVPQSMAYALIAGIPVHYGLYTSIVPTMVAALWGSSAQLITGPTNAISLVVFSSLSGMADPFTDHYLQLAFTLALLVGLIQLFLGLVRLGVLVNFVSHSVVIGFTAGAGVLIGIKQLKNLLFDPAYAATLPKVHSITATLWQAIRHLPHTHLPTLGLGLLTVAVILGVKRAWPGRWGPAPGPLVAMLMCGVVVALGGGAPELLRAEVGEMVTDQWVASGIFGSEGATKVVGAIPQSLPPLSMPTFDLGLWRQLFNAALAIALLGLLEAVSIAKAIASQTRQRLDGNQEFIGQGLCNIAASLFSGYACSGSFTRSAVNHEAGAQTGMAGLFSGVVVAVTVLLMAKTAAYLPISALAGMLIVVAYGMVDHHALKLSLAATRSDRAAVIVTFLATIFLHLEYAVYIGVGLSLVLYLARTSRPHVREWVPDRRLSQTTDTSRPTHCPQLPVVQVDGSLFFGSMGWFNDEIRRILRNYPDACSLILRMDSVNHLDATGAAGLEELLALLNDRGGHLYLGESKREVVQVLKNSGLLEKIGSENLFLRTRDALHKVQPTLDPRICAGCSALAFEECQTLQAQARSWYEAAAVEEVSR
ncbi:MAG TPA: SulP family inorganic anion transporter [bacterium]